MSRMFSSFSISGQEPRLQAGQRQILSLNIRDLYHNSIVTVLLTARRGLRLKCARDDGE